MIRTAIEDDLPEIISIARKTWPAAYGSILSAQQLNYMLGSIYSHAALLRAMRDGQEFIIVEDQEGVQGFASFGQRREDPLIYKLHKLYVLPGAQGKGYGMALLGEVVSRIKKYSTQWEKHGLDLNVNRYNPARSFYEKAGFFILREEDVPIGTYWMNDYVMRLSITLE